MHRVRRFPTQGATGAKIRFVGRERGVALILVLGLLALLTTVVLDFQFTSRVDLQLAYNARDELQAEANALSALRMRALILKQSRKVQDVVKALGGALGGGAGGGGGAIGQILEMIPVECGLLSAITKQSAEPLTRHKGPTLTKGKKPEAKERARGHDEEAREDFFVGECMATSESEHAKIAINLLRNNIQNRSTQVASLLLALLSDPRLRPFFESDDRNGQHAESPVALVQAITDWIDSDHTEAANLGDEDRHYQSLKDPYRTKNAPFDSVAELQLVHGVSDVLYKLLRDNVTIYNDTPAIELGTAPIERILYWGLPAALKDTASMEAFGQALPAIGLKLQAMRALGPMVPLTTALLTSQLQQSPIGALFDTRKLGTVFSDSSSTTWYTIVAEGRMGHATRRIRAVFQASEGQFYHVRIE